MANHIIKELIKKSKEASLKNRGAYPVTCAKNVFFQNGTTIESDVPADVEIPDVIVNLDLVEDPASIATVISELEKDSVVEFSDGEIGVELVIGKGVTLQGANAGKPQNFRQGV